MPRSRSAFWLVPIVGVLALPVYGQHVQGCGNLANSVGPFDYYDRDARPALSNVETNHFTPDVEALRTGKTDVRIIGDIDFVLRHFPNHPRALNAVATYALRGGQFRKDGIPSADCYFRRALVFRPEDATVRMLYANYLTRRGSIERAMEQYEEALRLAPESPEVNYNAGLFFVGQGDIERAKQLASAAYAGGYPLPGLRRKIESAEATQVK